MKHYKSTNNQKKTQTAMFSIKTDNITVKYVEW